MELTVYRPPESINNHLTHIKESDPSNIVYEAYLQDNQIEKAEKYLEYRKRWKKIQSGELLSSFPPQVIFDPCNVCNLSCPHCYQSISTQGDYDKPVFIPLNRMKELLLECKDLGVHSVLLGVESEFFCYPHADDILEYVGSLEFDDLWVYTNGLLLNDKRMELILKYVTKFSVSLDAISPKTYKKVRGGDFYKVMANIFSFLQKRGGKKIPIFRVSIINYNLTKGDVNAFILFWENIVDDLDVQSLIDLKNIEELNRSGIREGRDYHCNYPKNLIYIDSFGNYRPCCLSFGKHLIIGNINEMSIMDAWNSDLIKDLRLQFEGKKSLNNICVNCLNSFNSNREYEALI